jgi:ATP-dependent RNA helicase RhlE
MFHGAVQQGPPQTSDSFADLGLDERLVRSLDEVGFEHPTLIQAEVIPRALQDLDIVGLAQTGSGKTAAFSLPILQRLFEGKGTRALILCPTREIAMQTRSFIDTVGKKHGLKTACLIGGVKYGPQITDLRRKPDVVVATPGRLWDHFERKNVRLNGIRYLVLDEADHMLDLGFLPQINRILGALPSERQTFMFSATMPTTIENLAKRFMREPGLVDLRPKTLTASGIEHRLYLVDPKDTKAALLALVNEEEGSMLVFLRRKVDADWACRQLEIQGHEVERIHSGRSQKQRVAALDGLRKGKHRILLATNVAARGIDIPIIEHIVNYGMPDAVEDYVHRAGRTARGAMKGTVSTIATWQDKETIGFVEKAISKSLPRCTLEGVEPWVERKKTIRGRKKLRRRF